MKTLWDHYAALHPAAKIGIIAATWSLFALIIWATR